MLPNISFGFSHTSSPLELSQLTHTTKVQKQMLKAFVFEWGLYLQKIGKSV